MRAGPRGGARGLCLGGRSRGPGPRAAGGGQALGREAGCDTLLQVWGGEAPGRGRRREGIAVQTGGEGVQDRVTCKQGEGRGKSGTSGGLG